MSKHSATDDSEELDYDWIIPPETSLFVRVLWYLLWHGLAALGFWCIYLEIFVRS